MFRYITYEGQGYSLLFSIMQNSLIHSFYGVDIATNDGCELHVLAIIESNVATDVCFISGSEARRRYGIGLRAAIEGNASVLWQYLKGNDGLDEMLAENSVWVCGPCADPYSDDAIEHPHDGYGEEYRLEYVNGSWTCPHCGRSTFAPEEDGCYQIY